MNRMVRISRPARAAAAAAAAVLAGALALPTLRRLLPRMFATLAPTRGGTLPSERPEHVDSQVPPLQPHERTGDTPTTAPPTEDPSTAPRRRPSRRRRARAYVRRGLTTTVLLLLVVGAGTAAYAFHLRPDNAIPQVGSWNLDIAFGPHHFATSPMLVAFDMVLEEPDQGIGTRYLRMYITMMSPDLRRAGWTLTGSVPEGVELFGQGRVVLHPGAQDFVIVSHGAARSGIDSVILTWRSPNSGPLRIQGANLVAMFPELTLENDLTGSSGNTSVPASPLVTLTRELQPGDGDYAYLGGQPPDHQEQGEWYWDPVNQIPGVGIAIFSSLTIEARSVTIDEQSHSAEFLSGVLFGVAAAALIAALQEFLNSARKRKSQAVATSADT
jgi:hypothetical protein